MSDEDKELAVDNLKVTLSPWPKTGMQVLSLLIVALFLSLVVVLLAYQDVFRHDLIDALRNSRFRIWSEENDQPIAPTKTKYYRLAFWTPSAETAADLNQQFPNGLPPEMQWQLNVTEDRLREFGAFLKKTYGPQLLGYRRSAVFGQGQTTMKSGCWWTMTVTPSLTVEGFAHTYKTFWGTRQGIYVETTGDFRYID